MEKVGKPQLYYVKEYLCRAGSSAHTVKVRMATKVPP